METTYASGINSAAQIQVNFSGPSGLLMSTIAVPDVSPGAYSGKFTRFIPDINADIATSRSSVNFQIISGATGSANSVNMVNCHFNGFFA